MPGNGTTAYAHPPPGSQWQTQGPPKAVPPPSYGTQPRSKATFLEGCLAALCCCCILETCCGIC
ncbi:hypothetical protein KP509_17G016500 [Ceratopteris richardii]|uniref:Cysteine-rich transmembrane domain-containing protein n=1 Tax=Ceratopteris richardii TaxID=49495 RepID=A0A8T2SW78_CERRI|nr:hypothetical protein KP509_17G016500 [Ceratopteris richardii]